MLYVSFLKKLGRIFFSLIVLINDCGKIDLCTYCPFLHLASSLSISSLSIVKRWTLNGRYVIIIPILTVFFNIESNSRGILLTTNFLWILLSVNWHSGASSFIHVAAGFFLVACITAVLSILILALFFPVFNHTSQNDL